MSSKQNDVPSTKAYVEVIDASSKHVGKVGTVAFLVGDNVHVRFGQTRWAPTRFFFSDQLRAAPAPQQQARLALPSAMLRTLRLSFLKIRL